MKGFGVQKSIPFGNISERGISILLLYGTSDTTFIGSMLFNNSLPGTSQREVIVFYYYMRHLIQLSLVLLYFIAKKLLY